MSEITQEEALRQADALVGQALRETEARCTLLGQYINDCDNNGSKPQPGARHSANFMRYTATAAGSCAGTA